MLVERRSTPHRSARIGKPAYFVIHRMQGSYEGTLSWFQNPKSEVSADECINKPGSKVCVFNTAATRMKCWQVGNANSLVMGVEIEGFEGQDESTLTDGFYDELASRLILMQKRVKETYGVIIPLKHSLTKGTPGIVGHNQIAQWYGGSNHTDGTAFRYARLERSIQEQLTPQYVAELWAGGKLRKRVRYGEGRVKALLDDRKLLNGLLEKYGNFRVRRVKVG